MGDGAGNQAYVDEIKIMVWLRCPICRDLRTVCAIAAVCVGGNFVDQGTWRWRNYDPPTLERPGSTFEGAAIYFAFGLEGVNDDTGFNTRADLLGAALDWGWDEADGVDHGRCQAHWPGQHLHRRDGVPPTAAPA